MKKIFTVLTAELLHETNTFCSLPTTLGSFVEGYRLMGDEKITAREKDALIKFLHSVKYPNG